MSIITKKAPFTPNVPARRMGVTLSLPFLESMVPAHTPLAKTAANPQIRLGFCFIPHGAVMANWTPALEGPLQLSPHSGAARAVQGSGRRRQQPGACDGRSAGSWRQRRRPHALPGGVPEWRASQANRRRRYSCRRDDRPDSRSEDRTGHAAAVARTRDRGLQRSGGLLRRRFQLHLHEHDFLEYADHADADGNQSARRVRSDVRGWRHAEERLERIETQRSILDAVTGQIRRLQGQPGIKRSQSRVRISGHRARNRTAHPAGREAEQRSNLDVPVSPSGIPDDFIRAHEADVRPDGHRVPGRHHPRSRRS